MLPQPHNPDTGSDDRRRAGRIKTPGVMSDWGAVEDVSSSGLRIIHKGPKPADEGTETTISLRSRLSTFSLSVRIVRVIKIGFRKWQLGVEITEADPAARKELTLLARAAAQGGSVYR